MEYLLREKLEKLVQSQIEARMVSMRRDGKSFDASVVAALKVGEGRVRKPSGPCMGCTPLCVARSWLLGARATW
jgi:hypothetical protein